MTIWRGSSRRVRISVMLALMLPAGVADAAPPRPDLIVDQTAMQAEWTVVFKYIPPGDCAIEEGCVLAPGVRKLLTFTVKTANISQAELNLGDPTNSPFFEYSPCHDHYHLLEFSDYRLSLPGTTGTLVTSRKQSWCLGDVEQYLFEPWVPTTGRHHCSDQGLLPGWADVYAAGLECQWLDVTNFAPGAYDMTAEVNSRRRIHESDYTNNTTTVPVTIPNMDGDPDLTLDTAGLLASVITEYRFFSVYDPAVQDGCVGGYGYRRLMRFELRAANVGQFDIYLGDPIYAPLISFDAAHGHTHVQDLLQYQLFDLQGVAATPPRTHPLWLPTDGAQYLFESWVRPIDFYWSGDPGLQRGWSSYILSNKACQWVDVTGLPNGPYTLRATINPLGLYRESNFINNTKEVAVHVTDPLGGIPSRPDGTFITGQPLEAEPAPAGTRVIYDVAASCPATDYDLLFSQAPPASSVYHGAVCSIGVSGDRVVTMPDPAPGVLLWFLVVGRNGAIEGGHGFDSEGRLRPLSGEGFCGVTASRPQLTCRPPE